MKSRNTVLCIMAIILFINFLVFKANALILSPEEAERIEMLLKELWNTDSGRKRLFKRMLFKYD